MNKSNHSEKETPEKKSPLKQTPIKESDLKPGKQNPKNPQADDSDLKLPHPK
jgi:hypothetical protein